MNFADTLRNYNPEEDKIKSLEMVKTNAIRTMVEITQKAIEHTARKASLTGLRKISGYVTVKNDYDADPIYCITEQWGYDVPDCQNVGIYQIDTISNNSFIPSRTPKQFFSKEQLSSQKNSTCKLTKQEVDVICTEVAVAIRSMGFNDYLVEAVPMHFYCGIHEKRTGLFGTKWVTEKIDDGIGHVLKVTIAW